MKKALFSNLFAVIVKMRRIIFMLCITGLAVAILPAIATADSVEPGNDGYTYVYQVYVDSAAGPRIEFSSIFQGQFSKAQLTTMIKGFPSQTVGKADIYFMPEVNVTAVVYYNSNGFSTTVLLITDALITPPSETP